MPARSLKRFVRVHTRSWYVPSTSTNRSRSGILGYTFRMILLASLRSAFISPLLQLVLVRSQFSIYSIYSIYSISPVGGTLWKRLRCWQLPLSFGAC